jgi:hypothetical protein
MNKIKEALVIKHYAQTTKKIFNFLAEFFGNKFYNIIYNLSIQYTKKNNLSVEDNYLNIIENYLDSLIIKSKQEEDKKGKIISNFVKILYENYMKYIDNQMIEMDEFLIKIVQSFLPDHHRNEIYIKDKNNVAIMFHTIILNISEDIIDLIKKNLHLILENRIKENLLILKKDCIYIFCKVKENLENNFNKIENNEEDVENEEAIDYENIVKNSSLYKELEHEKDNNLEEKNKYLEDNKKLKMLIKELILKNNKLNTDIIKLKKLLLILNEKIKSIHTTNTTNTTNTLLLNDMPCINTHKTNETVLEENMDTNINDILNDKIEDNPFTDLLIK